MHADDASGIGTRSTDRCPFDPASEAWRAALGDTVGLHQGRSNSINLVMGDQSVATWMHDAQGTTVVCRKRVIWRAVLKQVLSLWDHLLPIPVRHRVAPVVVQKHASVVKKIEWVLISMLCASG